MEVDPASVPCRTLSSGAKNTGNRPGDFGSDTCHTSGRRSRALRRPIGYRHFDCASVYGNETEIGVAFEEILRGGIRREELWITSKLWNDKHGEDDVMPPARSRWPTYSSSTWTCTWCTGRFPTSIRRAAM